MCYTVQPYHSGKFHKGDETAVVQDEQLQHNSVMFQALVHSHTQTVTQQCNVFSSAGPLTYPNCNTTV